MAVSQPREYPTLRHSVITSNEDAGTIFVICSGECFEIKVEAGEQKYFLQLVKYFDGRHSIEQIIEKTGIEKEDLIDTIEVLSSMNLFKTENSVSNIEKSQFFDKFEKAALMWSRQLNTHRLYKGLEQQQFPKDVLIGMILETYHYVASAPKHSATAIAHCNDKRLENILTHFFVDEYNHARLLLKTLENLGLSREQVINSKPLAGTQYLINTLCDLGRRHTLCYFGGTALFEGRADDFDQSKDSLEKICSNYGIDPSAVEPMVDHLRGDIVANHRGLLEEALDNVTHLEASIAQSIVNSCHELTEAFNFFSENIITYYSSASASIPRQPVDYFAL